MSVALQEMLVALLVAACAIFSAWRLAPLSARLRLLAALAALPAVRTTRLFERLQKRTLARQAGACGGCSQGAKPAAASRNQTPGALRR
jgi:hypothetical protein